MKSAPQIFVSYIFSPGHTEKFYPDPKQDLIDFRKQYAEKSKTTASYLLELINFINEEDPTAILYVFGDHGPYMSRGIDIEKNSEFVVQDRYGVWGGIFPKDRCENTFSSLKLNKETFMTVSKVAHWIIHCLSNGENAILSPEGYKLPDMIYRGFKGIPSGVSNRYEDYLYE